MTPDLALPFDVCDVPALVISKHEGLSRSDGELVGAVTDYVVNRNLKNGRCPRLPDLPDPRS